MNSESVKVKCIIWDLDDTLWHGILAEGEDIEPKNWLVEMIKQLDDVGIINSICSKNDYLTAKEKLVQLGIWDFFVFPVIDFVPKGQNVKNIIDSLQLRAENCVFVDDNHANLREAEFYSSSLKTLDPLDPDFRGFLTKLVSETEGKSRLQQYKILEVKHSEALKFADNMSFLRDSEITVCLVRNPFDLTFKDRIIDLANRSNQLNFTKSRFPNEEDFDREFMGGDSVHIHHGVVFCYDKYGNYGLVGFYAFDERGRNERKLYHFFFSCRIMNMGVEGAVAQHLEQHFGVSTNLQEIFDFSNETYIRLLDEPDARVKDYIEREMGASQEVKSTIIAGCTSGVISHYLQPSLKPSNFQNFSLSKQNFDASAAARTLIYTVYSDYLTKGWSDMKIFSYRRFKRNLENFVDDNADRKIFLIMASERFGKPNFENLYERLKALEGAVLHGRSMTRNKKCNKIVRTVAETRPNILPISIDDFIFDKNEAINSRHFHRSVIERVCQAIA